ncbi:MAG: transketolase family protein [Chloroflexi bacterium]|nr:transketolase family protein [Chloroflexota bacterium]
MMAEMSMREAYGRALAAYGAINPNVVALDADTSTSTFSNFFRERFPDRFLNIGIAEPCLVNVGVGLALGGKIPFVNAFSALLALRAAEQIRTCVCYARTNVKLAASYAGLSDFKDGATHHTVTDIAIMRALPEMVVVVPADANEMAAWVPIVAEYDGPVFLRISRAATLPVHDKNPHLELGKGLTLRDGTDLTIIATGSMVGRSLLAADQLAREGISARVLEIHTIKPIDVDLILQAAEETGTIVTAEEHSIIGGLGSAVGEVLGDRLPTPLERVGIADTFTLTALTPELLMDACGLAVADVAAAAKRALARKR